jgi:Carboxypeptidase regulatory-like domain
MKRFKTKALFFFSLLLAVFVCMTASNSALAQVSTAAMTGNVVDSSGSAVAEATITVTNLETGTVRTATTDEGGYYQVLSLPVGRYEVKADKEGFSAAVQTGINLVVGQQAVVNLTLNVGTLTQQVTVTAQASLVNTTTASVSGLVGEQQIKDLPLNGRSYDNLITLNPAATNYTSEKSYGFSGTGNQFVVAGRRQWENLFLLNGVEYTGASITNLSPGGIGGELLGIDATREFNVISSSYPAEYGKRSGAQVNIVTQSGTNALHGSAFEFLRNSALDARNYFDHPTGRRIPPFQRNQFGGALGGPIKKDRSFLFGNYEGLRQRLGLSLLTLVPDANARQGILPCGIISPLPSGCTGTTDTTPTTVPSLNTGMLPFLQDFWPLPNAANLGGGVAQTFSNPKQSINEDFGTLRFDQIISDRDTFSAAYTIDSGLSTTPLSNPVFAADLYLRNQVLSLQETHTFSPHLINTFLAGVSRGAFKYDYNPVVALPSSLSWLAGSGPGALTIGGGQAGGGTLSNGLFAQTHGYVFRTLFTYEDKLQIVKGAHQISLGVFFQPIRSNEMATSKSLGQASFTNLQSFLQGTVSNFSIAPNHIPGAWRQLQGAWYIQDSYRVSPRLMLTAGLRYEITNGWNEATGRGSIFLFGPNGAPLTVPKLVSEIYPQNDATKLFAPRLALAWDPFGKGKTSVRAGWGIYYNLVDSSLAGGPTNSNPPFNGAESFSNVPILSLIPVAPGVALPPQCNVGVPNPCTLYQPKGNDPHLKTPTVESWDLTVEQELSANTVLRVSYLGSFAYHQLINRDANSIAPLVCSDPAGCTSGGLGSATATVPSGTLYIPVTARPNPYLATTLYTFFSGIANYNALAVDVERRFANGLQFRGTYTWSRNLDDGSGIGNSVTANTALSVENPYNLRQDYGVSPLNITNQASGNFVYDLPFGAGKTWLTGATGPIGKLVSGWQVSGIITLQSGFSFSPQVGSNRSGNGDNSVNPDRPSLNPAFTGPIIIGTQQQWFNRNAFSLPLPGTWGDLRRATLLGPGLATVDFSMVKRTSISERVRLEFRAEFFNMLNHTNFGLPNIGVFSGTSYNPGAGLITTTATTSRQVQFGLKLIF